MAWRTVLNYANRFLIHILKWILQTQWGIHFPDQSIIHSKIISHEKGITATVYSWRRCRDGYELFSWRFPHVLCFYRFPSSVLNPFNQRKLQFESSPWPASNYCFEVWALLVVTESFYNSSNGFLGKKGHHISLYFEPKASQTSISQYTYSPCALGWICTLPS